MTTMLDARARAELEMQRSATAEAAQAAASVPKNPLAGNQRAADVAKAAVVHAQAPAPIPAPAPAPTLAISPPLVAVSVPSTTLIRGLSILESLSKYEAAHAAAFAQFKTDLGA